MQIELSISHVRNNRCKGHHKTRSPLLERHFHTAPFCKIYLIRAAIADPLHHAGMIKVMDNTGANIYLEVFKLPTEKVGSFLQQIPPPLGLGTVDLEDGKSVKGFICEGYIACGDSGLEVEEITHLQSWLDYVKQRTC